MESKIKNIGNCPKCNSNNIKTTPSFKDEEKEFICCDCDYLIGEY